MKTAVIVLILLMLTAPNLVAQDYVLPSEIWATL